MSKLNIEKVIGEILSNEKNLIEFFSCENQDELYNYCMSKGTGYTREEFDEFIEETISKANCVSEAILNEEIIDSLDPNEEVNSLGFDKEINQNSLSDGGAKASFGKKIRQAFAKVLAAGLAVFSAVSVIQNLMPEAGATSNVSETAKNKELKEKNNEKNEKNNSKKLSPISKVLIAASGVSLVGLGAIKLLPGFFKSPAEEWVENFEKIKEAQNNKFEKVPIKDVKFFFQGFDMALKLLDELKEKFIFTNESKESFDLQIKDTNHNFKVLNEKGFWLIEGGRSSIKGKLDNLTSSSLFFLSKILRKLETLTGKKSIFSYYIYYRYLKEANSGRYFALNFNIVRNYRQISNLLKSSKEKMEKAINKFTDGDFIDLKSIFTAI